MSYGTVSGYKAYHEARGHVISDQDDDEITVSLLVASEWLDGRYFVGFAGEKVGGRGQIFQWPRYGTFDTENNPLDYETVPREVENATYEAALKQLQTPGSLSVDFTPGRYKSARVEGAVAVQYASFSSAFDVQTQFSVIDAILAPIMNNNQFSPASGPAFRV